MSSSRSALPVLVLVVSLASACGAEQQTEKEFRADVLDVQSAGTLTLDVDGEERSARIAGIVVPGPEDCMSEKADEVTQTLVGDDADLEVTDEGVDGAGTQLVSLTSAAGDDIATELVARGVAVADAYEEDLTSAMVAARDEAMQEKRGFFRENGDCTFAAHYTHAMEVLDDANGSSTPTTSSAAGPVIAGLVTAVATGKAAERIAHEAHRDLRVLAYPPATLATMTARLATRLAATRKQLRKTRALRKEPASQERRERRRKAAEAQRLREAQAAERLRRAQQAERQRQTPSPAPSRESSSDSGGSGNSHPGYTGPRCYEPGGKVWHPC